MNAGDHFEGNTFGPVTGNVGSGGTFIQSGRQLSLGDLDALVELLGKHQADLAEPELAIRTAEELRSEFAADQPRGGFVADRLTALARYAGNVQVIGDAIDHIRRTIESLLT